MSGRPRELEWDSELTLQLGQDMLVSDQLRQDRWASDAARTG